MFLFIVLIHRICIQNAEICVFTKFVSAFDLKWNQNTLTLEYSIFKNNLSNGRSQKILSLALCSLEIQYREIEGFVILCKAYLIYTKVRKLYSCFIFYNFKTLYFFPCNHSPWNMFLSSYSLNLYLNFWKQGTAVLVSHRLVKFSFL